MANVCSLFHVVSGDPTQVPKHITNLTRPQTFPFYVSTQLLAVFLPEGSESPKKSEIYYTAVKLPMVTSRENF